MIQVRPPLGKYKYDTWRILPVKCYIDNSMRLRSCIRNVNILKSEGATYQRGIQRCLQSQIGRNAEAYVDDVVVKTREDEGLISELADTFDNLRKFKMKLNPKK
jgi:hypothetical protein